MVEGGKRGDVQINTCWRYNYGYPEGMSDLIIWTNINIKYCSWSRTDHATTSAALKLLRLRLTGLKPGRSDFVAGTTTALGLLSSTRPKQYFSDSK